MVPVLLYKCKKTSSLTKLVPIFFFLYCELCFGFQNCPTSFFQLQFALSRYLIAGSVVCCAGQTFNTCLFLEISTASPMKSLSILFPHPTNLSNRVCILCSLKRLSQGWLGWRRHQGFLNEIPTLSCSAMLMASTSGNSLHVPAASPNCTL